jgi:acetyltransferase-like isoleucine patch superfamily enzyme
MSYNKEQKKRRWILTIFGSKLFSFPKTYKMRIRAYQKCFNIGANPIIENNVWLSRTHGLDGKVKMGDRVLLARNVSIDYSGEVILEDDVWVSEGAEIDSHIHLLTKERWNRTKNSIVPTKIILRKGCWIGSRAIILPQAEEVGENSVVAAGAVVTKKVPSNVIVAGNPAKVIRNIL